MPSANQFCNKWMFLFTDDSGSFCERMLDVNDSGPKKYDSCISSISSDVDANVSFWRSPSLFLLHSFVPFFKIFVISNLEKERTKITHVCLVCLHVERNKEGKFLIWERLNDFMQYRSRISIKFVRLSESIFSLSSYADRDSSLLFGIVQFFCGRRK